MGKRCLLPFLLLILGCDPEIPTNEQPPFSPTFIIYDRIGAAYWHYDSLMNDIIQPANWKDDTGQAIIHIGAPDYRGVTFPHEKWGLLFFDYSPSDTFHCLGDTCWSKSTGKAADMGWYFDSLKE